MSYTGLNYYLLTAVTLALYAALPMRRRWMALLFGSLVFYVLAVREPLRLALFFLSILLSWGFGLLLGKYRERKAASWLLPLSLLLCAAPLLLPKADALLPELWRLEGFRWILPMGLAFYTLQMLSYLCDIASGKITAERNLARYALFVSFFPQILQGPIPRWSELSPQLFEGHEITGKNLLEGLQLVLWGFFLKWMIADKAAIVVNQVFDSFPSYQGVYVFLAGILYSLQLYTDFLACVTLSQGVAQLFGISLTDNFRQPYFSRSIREFWQRWHISLSRWLKDYVYIPLGGNRKGTLRKYVNLLLTFLVSGLWHGASWNFVIWGCVNGLFLVLTSKVFSMKPEGAFAKVVSCLFVFSVWALSLVFFRTPTFADAMAVFSGFGFSGAETLKSCGMGLPELRLSFFLIAALALLEILTERSQKSLESRILSFPTVLRWTVYILVALSILYLGVYGANDNSFIYFQF